MTIKVYISGICGSQEVRKHQQRVLFILQTMPIDLQIIDVTEPGREDDLIFMQEEAKKHDKKTQLPPQIFNDNEYCGDYADFQLANDDDEIMRFLKLEEGPSKSEMINNAELSEEKITQNGIGTHDGEANKDDAERLDEHSNEPNENIHELNVNANVETNSDETKETDVEKVDTGDNEIASEALSKNDDQKTTDISEEKKAEASSEESEEESE